MKIRKLFLAAAMLLPLVACKADLENMPADRPQTPPVNESAYYPGFVNVQVTDELAELLLSACDENGEVVDTKSSALNIPGVDVKGIRTLFYIGGPYENLQRQYGLHKWFTVEFDETASLTKSVDDIFLAEGVTDVEPIARVKRQSVQMNDFDPSKQWHYQNKGGNNRTEGVDIKLKEAWDAYQAYGSEDVIVAIVDGGVKYDHPDLKDNMWVNEAELNGQPGVDDDGNGYVDDIYGYNFVGMTSEIYPDDHGTHVAGTVAACNNNGVGVCGVAGGRYPDIKGVRLMSVQILDESRPKQPANDRKAFQYAMENGAQIAQNSWGYEQPPQYMPTDLKDAIDYFIDNAGKAPDGSWKPDIKMRGGVAIFAAGNESLSYGYPAQYERVIAVASVGPTGDAASYTSYGDWVDVCAPGGDQNKFGSTGGVYSTTKTGYNYFQGTSMACPHVSGVAALVLSVNGSETYTNTELFNTILNSVDESIYDHVNMGMQGKLGKGIVNTVKALESMSTEPPAAISHLEAEVRSNSIVFKADVPKNSDGVDARYYYVYYSKSAFTTTSGVSKQKFTIASLPSSDGYKVFELKGLDFNTQYWYAVTAANISGKESVPTEVESLTTGGNTKPVIEPEDKTEFKIGPAQEDAKRVYSVSDPDGHAVTVSISQGSESYITLGEVVDGKVTVTVNGLKGREGVSSFTLKVTDEYGEYSKYEQEYEILRNSAPVKVKPIESMCINGVNSKVMLNVADYFTDPDGEKLTVLPSISDRTVVSFVQDTEKGILTFVGLKLGQTDVTLKASDNKGASVTSTFTIAVRDNTKKLDVYPNPVFDYVNLRTGAPEQCEVSIYTSSGSLIYGGSHLISSSNPLKINMSNSSPGRYTVKVIFPNGEEITSGFVKL